MDKITVSPQDDPSAANAEIEIIATATEADGKLLRVLTKVKVAADFKKAHLGNAYAEKCVRLGFEKQGYQLWKHNAISTVLRDDDGNYYVSALFQRNEL